MAAEERPHELWCCGDCIYITEYRQSVLYKWCDAQKRPVATTQQACKEDFAPRGKEKGVSR